MQIERNIIEKVMGFKYLGITLNSYGKLKAEVKENKPSGKIFNHNLEE